MGMSNFMMTVMGVGAVYLLLRGDVRDSANILKRNVRHIRNWIEEESAAASKNVHAKPKEGEAKLPEKDIPKEDKH